jgi:hypothetical protein
MLMNILNACWGHAFICQYVESCIGIVYLVSFFGANVLSTLFDQKGVLSSALFILMATMLSNIITWTIYDNKFATFLFIIVTNLDFGLLPPFS